METNYFPFTSWSVPIERLFTLQQMAFPTFQQLLNCMKLCHSTWRDSARRPG